MYDLAHHYEYLVGGSEDEDTLERLAPAEVGKRVRAVLASYVPIGSVYQDGTTWVLSFATV